MKFICNNVIDGIVSNDLEDWNIWAYKILLGLSYIHWLCKVCNFNRRLVTAFTRLWFASVKGFTCKWHIKWVTWSCRYFLHGRFIELKLKIKKEECFVNCDGDKVITYIYIVLRMKSCHLLLQLLLCICVGWADTSAPAAAAASVQWEGNEEFWQTECSWRWWWRFGDDGI